jgi:hypothetical protein
MKRKTQEYQYDWMIWSTIAAAVNLFDSTPKELGGSLKVLPSFNNLLQAAAGCGRTGQLTFKMIAEYFENILTAHEKGKKLALGTFLSDKTIYFGFDNLVTMWVEPIGALTNIAFRQGSTEYYDYTVECGLTETSCAGQRALSGAALAGLAQKPDFVVLGSSGPCDTNANAVQFFSEYAHIPMLTLDTPATLVGEREKAFHFKDMKALVAEVEKLVGERINESRLREYLNEKKKQDEMMNELYDMVMMRPSPVPAVYHLFGAVAGMIAPGNKTATELFQSMLEDCRKNLRAGRAGTYSGKERTRLFMFYIDHYSTDLQFWDWLMANDISTAPSLPFTLWSPGVNYASEVPEHSYNIDTSSLDTMINSCAEINSRRPMNKQLRGDLGDSTQWLSDSKRMCKLFKPDCLVFTGTLGCRNGWGANKAAQRELERLGYPTLLAFVDCFDPRVVSWESYRDSIIEFMKVRKIPSVFND